MADNNADTRACGYKCGPLPDCAPLAVGLLAEQTAAKPQYERDKALARGTLFPSLDLPLGNIANNDVADVPLSELMAIDFAAHDLSLYLDTHPNDAEAFAVYRDLKRLCKEGHERYARLYGPISKTDLIESGSYTWLKGPWPWEYTFRSEG